MEIDNLEPLVEELGMPHDFDALLDFITEYEARKATHQPVECSAFYDSELEMAYIDGYTGKKHTDYVSNGDAKHIAGLKSVAVMATWGAARKINGELCDEVAALQAKVDQMTILHMHGKCGATKRESGEESK